MAELAEKLTVYSRDLFGYKGRVIRQASQDESYLVDNPNRRCPIITKSRTHLGYNPTVTLDEGLRRSLLWYHGNQTAEDA